MLRPRAQLARSSARWSLTLRASCFWRDRGNAECADERSKLEISASEASVRLNGKFQAPGCPLHTHEPVTVASFRTWRDWRDCVARDPMPETIFYQQESGRT
jgi:hypothetical protein